MEVSDARGRRSAHRGWDVLMRNAREQAEQYARALPADHIWSPFILVCDVGHAIEVFADFSGQGRNYRQFPDRAGFRIYLDDLTDPAIQARLRKIWTEPHALDPTKHAAEVTRDIAKRLASVSKLLEDRGHRPEPVAHFLMRVLFTMFAEDSGLLEQGSFLDVLSDARSNPDSLLPEAKAKKPTFPRDAIGQTAAVLAELRGGAVMTSEDIAIRYSQGRKVEKRIAATLEALARLGHIVSDENRYHLRKAA